MPENHHDDDQTQSFVPLTKGTELGHYKIISKIGAGGMGEVYLVEDTRLNRKIALKFIPRHMAGDSDMRARFTREAQAAAKLDHPNIVPVYEVGEYQGRPYFAMAHIEGKSLRDVIKDGKLGIDDAVGLTMQILEGLQEAHESGIVHRDIKPGNIIIDGKGRPRLVDFGLAMVSGEDKLTKTGSTLGTVGYMSPEQVEGKKCDHRSDLFSVGVILYEMLTGRRPFEGDNEAAVARAITDTSPEPIARYKSGTTGELQQIIDKSLSKDPSLRYQHADGMLADLKRLQMGAKLIRKSKPFYWIIAAIIVIIGGYFVFTTFFAEKPEPAKNKKVVVLPLENMGASDKDYFASGITEEITSRLTNIRGLAVISSATANRYRHSEKTMRQIGKELGADFIVNGSVQWQDNPNGEKRLKLTANLVKADEDISIWSKTYDTVMTEVFSVQSDIAEKVSEQMGIKLNVIDRKQLWERYTNSQEAYDFYLKGNEFRSRYGGFTSITDYRLAAEMFNKAIALDSNFILAYMGLSWSYCLQWDRGDHSDSVKQKALMVAQKVQDLAPGSKEAGIGMASYYYFVIGDSKRALDLLTEVFGNDLENPTYLAHSHNYLRTMGNWDEAYRRKKILVEHNPKEISMVYDLGQDCLYMRRYEEAEKLFDRVIEMQPDFSGAYFRKVDLYINWMGDIEKSRDVIRESYGKIDSSQWRYALDMFDLWEGNFKPRLAEFTMPPLDSLTYYLNVGLLYHTMRKPEIMRIYLDSALVHAQIYLKNNPDLPKPHYRMGLIYAGLGKRDEAIREGKKAVELAPLEKDALDNFGYLDYLLKIYIILDEKEKALDMLEHMLTVDNYFGLAHVFIDPDYTPMLDYPGFDKIVEKYGNKYARELWAEYQSKLI